MFDGLPPCQIISGANGLAIGTFYDTTAGATRIQVVRPNKADSTQLWQCVQYFDEGGFALVTMVNGLLRCLSAPGGVEWPFLTSFAWDRANLWSLGASLSALRDSAYCLTIYGSGDKPNPWPAGTKIQMYKWQKGHYDNQNWTIKTVK